MTVDGNSHAARSVASRQRGRHGKGSRRRGVNLEGAILQAAWDQLHTVGYANLTMEGVAARARTSKAVLYRRWPNRAKLVLAAMRKQGPMLSGDAPDTGDLRSDVLALLRRVSAGLSKVGQATIHGLLAEYFQDPELSLFLSAEQAGTDRMMTILKRAAERGEVRIEKITPRIASLPIDLARHELLITGAPVPDITLIEIVDEIFLPLVRS